VRVIASARPLLRRGLIFDGPGETWSTCDLQWLSTGAL